MRTLGLGKTDEVTIRQACKKGKLCKIKDVFFPKPKIKPAWSRILCFVWRKDSLRVNFFLAFRACRLSFYNVRVSLWEFWHLLLPKEASVLSILNPILMTKAKLRETNKLQRFECTSLSQKSVEQNNKGIFGLCVWKENIDGNIGLSVH